MTARRSMADDEPDRLSQLPNNLLQHILDLAPCREAESTAVLSRRWRGVWPPPTGVVTLNIPGSIDSDEFSEYKRRREALIRGAKEAIAAAHGPVKRLSFHVGDGCEFVDAVVDDVLSDPASCCVQDVRIAGDDSSRKDGSDDDDDDDDEWSWLPNDRVGEFEFGLDFMDSAAHRLRVLHITNCSDLRPPPQECTIEFPCLEVLRLRMCTVDLQRLQDMVVASPRLTVLQLEYVYFVATAVRSDPTPAAQWQANQWQANQWEAHQWEENVWNNNYNDVGYYNNNYFDDYSGRRRWYLAQSLCCPGITTLVLLNCDSEWGDDIAIELDVPRVQHFRFRGRINQFTLRSPLPDVRRVYMHFLANNRARDIDCETFWNLLKNFGNAKVMKLKLEWSIDYVAVQERERFMEILGETLFNIEHLEIDAPQKSAGEDVAVAIGNFLQCCPFIVDLRLKLSADQAERTRNSWRNFLKNKADLEFQKSIDQFKHRRYRPVIPLHGDNDKVEVVSDIPVLGDRWFQFSSLRCHLRRLSLQFPTDKPDCVGARLAKFFVERGMALEEMYIEDGNMRLWEHMNCKIKGYPANPQPISPEHHVLARMSQAFSLNQFSSSKISGSFHHSRLELKVRRTHPSAVSRSFKILPLADA